MERVCMECGYVRAIFDNSLCVDCWCYVTGIDPGEVIFIEGEEPENDEYPYDIDIMALNP